MQLSPRLAAAAVIGVLAIGGGFLLLSGPNAQVGKPSPSPTILGSPKASAEAVQGYANLPGWIVFERNVPSASSGSTNRGDQQLWAVHADGSGLHELAPGKPADSAKVAPDISPDGRMVAFSTIGPPKTLNDVDHLWQAPIGGGAPVLLSTPCDVRWVECDEFDPAYSANGKRMAFVEFDYGATQSLVIGLLDLTTGNVTFLESTRTSSEIASLSGPTWSPDGLQIAYTFGSGGATYGPRTSRVLLVNAGGTGLHELSTAGVLVPGNPKWAPDGSSILFESLTLTEPFGLYKVRPDGSGLTDLCVGPARCGQAPSWTPDGKHILYWNFFDGWKLMDPDGANKAPINAPALNALSDVGGSPVVALLQPTP